MSGQRQNGQNQKDLIQNNFKIVKGVNVKTGIYINLDRSKDRKKSLLEQITLSGLDPNKYERISAFEPTVYEKEKELLELDIGQREAVIKLLREGRDISEVDNFQRETQHNFGESEV